MDSSCASDGSGGTGKGAVVMIFGFAFAIIGFFLMPSDWYLSNTESRDLYFPSFFLLLGVGLVLLGIRKMLQ